MEQAFDINEDEIEIGDEIVFPSAYGNGLYQGKVQRVWTRKRYNRTYISVRVLLYKPTYGGKRTVECEDSKNRARITAKGNK
jgi:hypothetical protein